MRFPKVSALLALSLALVQPVSQAAASQVGVDSAFKNLQYTLNSKWDQKDPAVRDAAVQKFQAEIEALRASGVTDAEIIASLKASAIDENAAKDIEQIASSNLSQAEKMHAVKDIALKQGGGAQWSGMATGVAVGVIVAAVIIAALLSGGNGYYYDSYYYDPYYCDPYYYYCY